MSSAFKRLLAYVSSHATGCRYCQAHAIRAAERYGADAGQIANIWEYRTHPAFDEGRTRGAGPRSGRIDRAERRGSVRSRTRLHEHWDDGEIVEILGVIALFGFLNRWNDSMATSLEATEYRVR